MVRSAVLLVASFVAFATQAIASGADDKFDSALRARALAPRGESRVIIQTNGGVQLDALLKKISARAGRRLPLLHGQVAVLPDSSLMELAAEPGVRTISLDRRVRGTMERTAATVGAPWVWSHLGFDGSGIGVAILDSGVTAWHDDLSQRVVHFADFVNHQASAYDDFGHGTHVAGIIAGSGYDSEGARKGIAPGASLVVLKVLDGGGDGYISNVIAAINYAVDRRADFNLRVLNLSVAAGVYESYTTDPLTLACKRAVDAGLVVVTSSGNFGRDSEGRTQYGGITAPGNAPWVITVGASAHHGTADRGDDTVAPFTSRGPSAIDATPKPDIVAPGVGIESLADSSSLLFTARPSARLWGTLPTASEPYLSMTGSSMASPVVSGTIALMLEANPALTPNLVKAILQYTAEERSAYSHLVQGAGFLNARGAVQLARAFADPLAMFEKDPTPWSRQIIWGRPAHGGVLSPVANAWTGSLVWGAQATETGGTIVWGAECAGPECAGKPWSPAPAASGADVNEPDTAPAGLDFNEHFASAALTGAPREDAAGPVDGGSPAVLPGRTWLQNRRSARPRGAGAAA
jgi:serine protease AprX